ncbi:MAG: hypothetical protein O3B24_08500 [Verrucomicrobia bacterium]|nr:hypothetical protein [Verrucomicrobiota bacterium]
MNPATRPSRTRPHHATLRALLLCGALFILPACSSPPPVTSDAVTAQFADSARAAFDRGAYSQAVRFYDLALHRARARDDGPEIARNAYNLAACQLALGKPEAARAALREALTEFGRWRMDAQPALLLDARATLAAGDPAEAGRILDLAFGACKTSAQRVEVWLARGELAAAVGDADNAANALREADALRKAAAHATAPARQMLAGRVAAMQHHPTEAAQHFDSAAATAQQFGQLTSIPDGLRRAGEQYLLAGDARTATDRYFRAARSFHAQGNRVAALQAIEQGLAANTQAPDADLEALLAGLFATIAQSVAEAPSAP